MAEGVGAAPTCPILETGAFAAMLPLNMLVGETRLELARAQCPSDFKSLVATYYTTPP